MGHYQFRSEIRISANSSFPLLELNKETGDNTQFDGKGVNFATKLFKVTFAKIKIRDATESGYQEKLCKIEITFLFF